MAPSSSLPDPFADVGRGPGPRWCLWIDIEGFSVMFRHSDAAAIHAIYRLQNAVFAIGSRVFSDDQSRLFAHQFGDGVAIVSCFHEARLERCVSIACAIMRDLAAAGIPTRAAIGEGDFLDIGHSSLLRKA